MSNRGQFVRRSGILQGVLASLLLALPAAAQTAVATALPVPGATLGVTLTTNGTAWMSIDANAGSTAPACGLYCYDESVVRISATAGPETLPAPAMHFIAPMILGGDNNMWTYVQYIAPPGAYPGPNVHLQTGAITQCGLLTFRSDDNYTLYPTTDEVCGTNRSNMAALRDGSFWLVGAEGQDLTKLHLAKISTTGFYTRIPITLPALPSSFPAVADDSKANVWFASSVGKIARYTTTAYTGGPAVGTVTEFAISAGRVIKALKRGYDGNVWFLTASATSAQDDAVGFVTPAGVVTEYKMAGTGAILSQLVQGRDATTMWFLDSIDSENNTGPVKTGRITSDGAVFETPLPDFSTLVRGLGFKDGGRAIAQWAIGTDRVWFALHPATTIDGWNYVRAAVGNSSANFFPVRTASVYASSQAALGSFLRFANTGTSPGNVTMRVYNPAGQSLGTWTSPQILPNSELQYSIGSIEQGAGINPAGNTQYSVAMESSSITGNFQHVLYRPADGTLTNLSTCSVGVNAEPRILTGVHSSLIGAGFPSTIAIKNTGSATNAAVLGIYDARNGTKLGSVLVDNGSTRLFNEPQVGPTQAGAVTVVTMSYLETQAHLTPPDGAYHYVIKIENSDFTGFLQHLVNNTKLGVITDMTTSCGLGGATGAATATPNSGIIFSTAQTTSRSYLRFFNTDASAGTVTATFYDQDTNATLGVWTSPSIAPGAEQQVSVADIAATGVTTNKAYYTVGLSTTFRGYFQNVLYRPADGTLTNLSTCAAGVTAPQARLSAVHTSKISGFPSSVVINNTGAAATAYTLGIYDARNGSRLGAYTTASIPANGQAAISVAAMESAAGITPADGMFHYNIRSEQASPGYMQHLVDNQAAGVTTDMTTACAMMP